MRSAPVETAPGARPVQFDHRPDRQARLTHRQLAALRELADGATYEEAAYRLGISRHTLGRHLQSAYEALGAGSAIQAFMALGWLHPEDVA